MNAKEIFKSQDKMTIVIENLLQEALQVSGVGGKTAVGYGRFF